MEEEMARASALSAPEQTEDFDWLDTLTFLHTLSSSNVVQTALSGPRFLNIFMQLLQFGSPRVQLLTLRIFRRIFPRQLPEKLVLPKGKQFIATLMESIGSIHCLYSNIESLGHSFPIIKSFFTTLTVQTPAKVGEKVTSKLALSHPFFPFNSPEIVLPTGWDRKSTKSQVTLSEDTRTVTFNGYLGLLVL